MVRKFICYLAALCCCVSLGVARDLNEIRNSKVLVVGVLENYLPFSKKEEDGSFRGFEIELAQALADEIFNGVTGYKVDFIATRFTERIPFLQSNKVDLVIALFPQTDEAKQVVEFSMPYLSLNTGILTRTEDHLKTFKDIKDKRIALQTNTLAEKYILSKGINKEQLTYIKWYKDGYRLLINKQVDAVVGDNVAMLGYPVIDSNVEVIQKNISSYTFVSVGATKANKELIKIVNKRLIDLSHSGWFKTSYQNTFDPFYKGTADKKYFLLDDVYNILVPQD